MYIAVLDTCVLVPDLQRDFLLQLAAERAYTPRWGTGILAELDRVLEEIDIVKERADRTENRTRLLAQMNAAFPGSCVEAPRGTEHGYGLRDPGDEHVAHAALLGRADAIVTSDRRSGMERADVLSQAAIEVIPPHVFAANTIVAHHDAGVRAIAELSRRRRRPPQRPVEILDRLRERFDMGEVHELLRDDLLGID